MKKNFTTAKRCMHPNRQKHGFPRRFLILECFIHSPAAVTISRIWSSFARQSGQVSRCALLIDSSLNLLTPWKRWKSSDTISFSFFKMKNRSNRGCVDFLHTVYTHMLRHLGVSINNHVLLKAAFLAFFWFLSYFCWPWLLPGVLLNKSIQALDGWLYGGNHYMVTMHQLHSPIGI